MILSSHISNSSYGYNHLEKKSLTIQNAYINLAISIYRYPRYMRFKL